MANLSNNCSVFFSQTQAQHFCSAMISFWEGQTPWLLSLSPSGGEEFFFFWYLKNFNSEKKCNPSSIELPPGDMNKDHD